MFPTLRRENVRAIKQTLPEWGGDKLRYALDIHCPYISKRNPKDINDRLFFTAPQSEKANRNLEKFMASLEIPYTNISGKWKATPENAKHIGEKIVDATADFLK